MSIPAASGPGSTNPGPATLSFIHRSASRNLLKLLVALAVAGVLLYKLKFAPLPVSSHRLSRGTVISECLGTGTLEARVKTIISPRIQERLNEVLVDQGDSVRANQLLARLDDAELRRQVDVAEASRASAKATAHRVRVDETRAQAVYDQARLDHARTTDLLATKISSQSDMDKAIERLRIAETDLQRARAASVEAEQQILTAEKTLAYQRERLTATQIVAPYDGLITRRDRDPGGVVVPGSSLLQIISTNEIWVSAWVDETAGAQLALGQPARVVLRSDPLSSHTGEVARLGRETDRETREFLVNVHVRDLPKLWTLGQRAEVFIQTGHKTKVLALPPQFLKWRDGQPGVFVANSGRATWRTVQLGLQGSSHVEIVQGLSADDIVVAPKGSNLPALRDGQRVALQ